MRFRLSDLMTKSSTLSKSIKRQKKDTRIGKPYTEVHGSGHAPKQNPHYSNMMRMRMMIRIMILGLFPHLAAHPSPSTLGHASLGVLGSLTSKSWDLVLIKLFVSFKQNCRWPDVQFRFWQMVGASDYCYPPFH